MNERLAVRDLLLISAYLDSRLSPPELARVKARIQSDSQFKKSVDEIAYTRRLLQALPVKRAPRNFTLAAEKVKAPRRALWLQPALSFVSIAAALLLVVVFSSSYLFSGARSAAPAALAPQANSLAAERTASEPTNSPLINWGSAYGYGMGGGGGAPDTSYTGGNGIGGAEGPGFIVTVPGTGGGAPAPTEPPPTEPTPTAVPTDSGQGFGGGPPAATAAPAPGIATETPLTTMAQPKSGTSNGSDLSTLILGIPAKEAQGKELNPQIVPIERTTPRPISSTLVIMIFAGVTALLAGVAALIMRRQYRN